MADVWSYVYIWSNFDVQIYVVICTDMLSYMIKTLCTDICNHIYDQNSVHIFCWSLKLLQSWSLYRNSFLYIWPCHRLTVYEYNVWLLCVTIMCDYYVWLLCVTIMCDYLYHVICYNCCPCFFYIICCLSKIWKTTQCDWYPMSDNTHQIIVCSEVVIFWVLTNLFLKWFYSSLLAIYFNHVSISIPFRMHTWQIIEIKVQSFLIV